MMHPRIFNRKTFLLLGVLIALSTLFIWTCQKEVIDPYANPAAMPPPVPNPTVSPFTGVPHPDHIIFCFFENKGYTQIIGNLAQAPFINTLRSQGTLFTGSYALGHPSYPEYIRFFAGTSNGVTNDNCISGSTWTLPNLYTELAAAGKTFAWYSEGLPGVGSTVCTSGPYVEKHNPTTLFANVPPSVNKPFTALPLDYSRLENVVCITPNLLNDMHDGTIKQGDLWLQALAPLIEWCKTHNSIFVVYWDEDNGNYDNRIPVIAVGQHVKVNYQLGAHYNHYNWTRTICSMFKAKTDWTPNVAQSIDITGCWK